MGGTETRDLGLAGPSLLTSELPRCPLGFLSLDRRNGVSAGFSMVRYHGLWVGLTQVGSAGMCPMFGLPKGLL